MNIDYEFLDDLGLASVPNDQKDLMIQDINQILQERIGAKADEALTDEKRQELNDLLTNSTDQTAVQNWFSINLPNYPQLIQAEVERVKAEIGPQVAGILQNYSTAS